MRDDDDLLLDAFLRQAAADDPAAADLLARLAQDLEPLAPSPDARARLLASVSTVGRLHRFAAAIAKMIDVTVDRARQLLDLSADLDRWESMPLPEGARTLWVEGGPAVQGCIRGFLQLPPGAIFPLHQHLGDEQTLILQGRMQDLTSGRRYGPGDEIPMPRGSQHSYAAEAGGVDLVIFVVVRDGIALGDGTQLLHRDEG